VTSQSISVTAWNPSFPPRTQTVQHNGWFLFTGLDIANQPWYFTVNPMQYKFSDEKEQANVKSIGNIEVLPKPSCIQIALHPLVPSSALVAELLRSSSGSFTRFLVAPIQAIPTPQVGTPAQDVAKGEATTTIRVEAGKPSKNDHKEDKSVTVTLYAPGEDGQLRQVGPFRHPTNGEVFVKKGNLPASDIVVSAYREGFEPAQTVLTQHGTEASLNLHLKKISPEAGRSAISLNDSDPVRRAVFEPPDISKLPISGNRSVDSFSLLEPGVVPPPGGGTAAGPGIGPTLGTVGEVAVNGISPRLNSFLVDGVDNNDEDAGVRRGGFIFTAPYSLESIREFQIFTSLYDVQFGRGSGAQINVLTRTASTRFHASAYGYASGAGVSARNYFDAPPSRKDPNTSVATGLILDLPLGQTFISVSAEWRQNRTSQTTNFAVPTAANRSVEDAGVVGLPTLPNSTVGDAIFSLFPFPNNRSGPYGANTYSELLRANGQGLLGTIKLDRALPQLPLIPASWSNRIYITGANTAESNILPETGGNLDSSLRPNVHTYIGSVVVTTSAGPSTSNALRFSFGEAFYVFGSARDPGLLPSTFDNGNPFLLNRQMLSNETPSSSTAPVFTPVPSIPTTETVTGAVGALNVAGYSGLGIDVFRLPQHRRDATFDGSDIVTIAPKGLPGTTISGGLEYWHYRFGSNSNPNSLPFFQFNGAPTLNGTATPVSPDDAVSLALPAVEEQTLTTNPDTDLRLYRNQVDLFGSVQHRFRSNLTLTAGLRVEFNGLPLSTDGRFQNTYFNQVLSTSVAASDCFGCQQFLTKLQSAFPPTFTSVFAANRITFDPRIGFAWAPGKSQDWALRGGIGRYTSQFPASILDESRTLFPNDFTLNTAGLTVESAFDAVGPDPIASGGVRTLNSAIVPGTANLLQPQYATNTAAFLESAQSFLIAEYPSGHLLNPYTLQFHLTLERRLGKLGLISAAYVGSQGRHLLQVLGQGSFGYTPYVNYGTIYGAPILVGKAENSGLCGFPPTGGPPYFCGGIAEKLLETSGNSSYNSMQVEFRKGFSSAGLQVGLAFTYGRSMDDAPGLFDSAGEFAMPQNGYRMNLERAPSGFDERVRVPIFFDWEIPSGVNSTILKRWHFAGIVTAQTGVPFTVNTIYDVNQSGTLDGRLATAAPLVLGPVSGDPRVSIGAVAASLIPQLLPDGTDGAVGRNSFRASGLENADLSIGRTFALAEGKNLRVRLEAFNVFNHPEFGIPVRLLGAPAFGTSTNTSALNRRLQLNFQFFF